MHGLVKRESTAPPSSFKRLLLATGLLPRHRTMSLTAFQNDGLNDQDLERGMLQKRLPLSFIPHVVEEAEGFAPPTRKIKISELVEEKVVLFTGTTPEAYVRLQDSYEGLLRKKGYCKLYDKSEVVLKEAENCLDILAACTKSKHKNQYGTC